MTLTTTNIELAQTFFPGAEWEHEKGYFLGVASSFSLMLEEAEKGWTGVLFNKKDLLFNTPNVTGLSFKHCLRYLRYQACCLLQENNYLLTGDNKLDKPELKLFRLRNHTVYFPYKVEEGAEKAQWHDDKSLAATYIYLPDEGPWEKVVEMAAERGYEIVLLKAKHE